MGGDDDVVAGATHDVGAVLVGVDEQQVGPSVAHWITPSQEVVPARRSRALDL